LSARKGEKEREETLNAERSSGEGEKRVKRDKPGSGIGEREKRRTSNVELPTLK
jgi:hypothetical protein